MAFRLGLSCVRPGRVALAVVALALGPAARAAPPPGGGAPAPGSSWVSPAGALTASAAPAAPASPAHAATATPTPSPGAASSSPAAPVVVIVRAEGGELDAALVRAEIARELGVPAAGPEGAPAETRGTLTVTWRANARELVVGFRHPARGNLTRVVDAPERPAEVAHAAALLAGNLARDDAGELAAPTGGAGAAPAPAAGAPLRVAGHFSLFHPVATNRERPDATVNVSLNVIYGRVGGLDGMQFGPVNVVAGAARGAQLALGWNWARGPLDGVQFSLLGFNVAGGRSEAWQLAPIFNYVGGALAGVQTSLGANVAGDAVRGGQGALGLNYARGEVRGAQLAAINVAGDVRGLQAGFVNVGGRVKGAQVGLVNVADDVEGVPLGLISVTKEGGVHPLAWASSTTFGNAGVKFATRHTYTIAAAAYHEDRGRQLVGGGAAVGAQVPFDRTRFSFDLHYVFLYDAGACSDAGALPCGGDDFVRHRHLAKARLSAGYRFQPHLGIFLGAGGVVDVRRALVRVDPGRVAAGYDERVRVLPEIFGGLEF